MIDNDIMAKAYSNIKTKHLTEHEQLTLKMWQDIKITMTQSADLDFKTNPFYFATGFWRTLWLIIKNPL
jgi:hypothetical protein